MLTRLKVTGFKNLIDVDIPFGPFTCVAGANGVGKSNLFDAISFLSHLAEHTLIDAARSIRDEEGKKADVSSLFHRSEGKTDELIRFEAEMIIPSEGADDLGQRAEASHTFLKYTIELEYISNESANLLGNLQIKKEELSRIKKSGAKKRLGFDCSKEWLDSVILAGKTRGEYISTTDTGGEVFLRLHQDQGRGRAKSFSPQNLPRTILSTVNGVESPTASLVKKEMKSWRLLQLEPSALRKPDSFDADNEMGEDGSHLPATLFHLYNTKKKEEKDPPENWVYDQLAHRLRDLIGEISKVEVDRDDMRRLLTLMAYDRDGTPYPARSLSDGTLRFLALAVIELDFRAEGLFCLEEPENGIHPERVPAMLKLLQDIAVDPTMPPASDNLLRQVIVNTHSPLVVSEVPEESLLVVSLKEVVKDGRRFKGADFNWLSDTWRQRILSDKHPIDKGSLLNYLNPITPDLSEGTSESLEAKNKKRKVKQREDLQMLLPFYSEDDE